jgi:hypothetical protein
MKSIAKNKDSFEESRRVWEGNGFIKYKSHIGRGLLYQIEHAPSIISKYKPLSYISLQNAITNAFFGQTNWKKTRIKIFKNDTTRKTR